MVRRRKLLPLLIVLATLLSSAHPESTAGDEATRPSSPPLALKTTEARGPGRPLWRRWIDLDSDGRLDLVVVSGRSSSPIPSGGDQIADMVAYLRVTPDFLDRREILLYRQTSSGLVAWGAPLPLTGDTAAVDLADIEGDPRPEILYAAGFRVYGFSWQAGAAGFALEPRPLAQAPMLVGHTRSFVPAARLAAKLAGGSRDDLLLPTPSGLEIRLRKEGGGYDAAPDAVLRNPLRSVGFREGQVRLDEPAPRLVDADADGTLDLLFVGGRDMALLRGLGGGRFEREPKGARLPAAGEGADAGAGESPGDDQTEDSDLLAVNETSLMDINGDGRLDYLVNADGGRAREEGTEDAKAKEETNDKGRRETQVRIHFGRPGFTIADAPDAVVPLPEKEKIGGAFARPLKLTRNGRPDLLITRFSVGFFQLARVLVTKKITIKVQFESMLQREDGSFAPPRGKPFETKVTIDLKRGIESSPTSVRGDYDGDGITDLIEFSDRPAVLVHLTTPGGEFPAKAALSVPLPHPVDDSALVDIEDIDGDGRSDIAYFSPDGDGFVVTLLRSRP